MYRFEDVEEWVLRETAELAQKDQQSAQQVLQVLKRIVSQEPNTLIQKPEHVFQFCYDMVSLEQEHFVLLLLNSKNRVKKRKTIFIGSLNSTVVHPREVFRVAIENSSAAIICVHNHPSGDPTPSTSDIKLTNRLITAGEIIGIEVLDHVVVASGGYCSLRERGLI